MGDPPAFSLRRSLHGLIANTTGEQRVWSLTALVTLAAAGIAWLAWSYEPVASKRSIPFWVLAVLFYIAEVTVVHIKLKRNTQSFSLSEVPLVIGFFFLSPPLLLVAQLIGNLFALSINRRQPLLKLAFNMAQFSLVNVVAVTVFRATMSNADPFGPGSWLAAILAVAVGNSISFLLVHLAIRATGGALTPEQFTEVLTISLLGAAVNGSLALLAVTLFEMRPSAAFLALLPVAVLYLAYRTYVSQREHRARLEALYEITRVLHASPQIDIAIEAAARETQKIFESERVDIILYGHNGHRIYQTTVNVGGTLRLMAPLAVSTQHEIYPWLDGLQEAERLGGMPPIPNTTAKSSEVMAAPLVAGGQNTGVIIVGDPLSDVGVYGASDLLLLSAIADEVSVSLRNGRLEDSLEEVTQLKERLEEQVRGKDQFIATVSHELRTPLTTVLGLSEELSNRRKAFSESEMDEIVSLIANESGELSYLIEDLLVGARADVSTLSLHPVFASIDTELGAVVQGHAHQTSSAPVPIYRRTEREKVWADPLRLRQIVRNLLTNATRYGGDEIWIEVTESDGYVAVAVVDSGNGVPFQMESRIFEAYERGHDAVRIQPGSVGLGLAVSRRLAELMGGSLTYQRAVGNTRFELVLPTAPHSA